MMNECPCGSCAERRRLASGGKCRACDGRGVVPSASGVLRPCSRCRAADFATWTAAENVALTQEATNER